MAGAVRDLKDDPDFQALSPAAKKALVERTAKQDPEFSRLTAPAQELYKSRLTGAPRADISMTNTFVQGVKQDAGYLADKFGLTSKGPIESIANMVGVEDPGAVARFPDYAIKGLVAPFVGIGEAAKDITELGGAGVARLGRAAGLPFPEEATRPQETILSQGAGMAAEVASGFGPRLAQRFLPGAAAPEAQFGLQTPRQRVPPVAATEPLEGAARPGLGPVLAQGQTIPDSGLRPGAVPSLEQAAQTAGATITTGRGTAAVPAEILTPSLRNPVQKHIVEAAGDMFVTAGVKFDPNPARPLYIQVTDAVHQGKIPVPILMDALQRSGVSFEQFSNSLFLPATTRAGAQGMNFLSQLSKKIKAAGIQATPEEFERLTEAATQLDTMAKTGSMWRRATNAWRGLLVSQVSTLVRNATVAMARGGLYAMETAIDAGLQRAINIVNPDFKPTVHPLDGLETVSNLFRKGTKAKVNAVLEAFPEQNDRMYQTYLSDIAAKSRKSGGGVGNKAMAALEWGAHVANIGNRAQEWWFRRAFFQGRLAQTLRGRGMNLEGMVKSGRMAEIPEDAIKDALEFALEMTFANSPKWDLARKFISLVNAAPPVAFTIPFPRFMFNSAQFQLEHSPAGFLQMLSAAERAKIAGGNTQAVTRAILGTAMLGAAYDLRRSEYAHPKWYLLKDGDVPVEQSPTYDLRPYNPLAGYAFVSEIMHLHKEGRLSAMTYEDIAKGLFSVNVRAGLGLDTVNAFIRGFTSGDENLEEKFKRRGKETAGDILAGYLTPLQQIIDVMAEFEKFRLGKDAPIPKDSLRIVRDTRAEPFLGPLKARIPGLSHTLPEAQSPTRAGPMTRDNPLAKQATGMIVQNPQNPLEIELDRLGLEYPDVFPSSGNREADNLVKKHMGPMVERLGPMVQSAWYRKRVESQREVILVEALEKIRETARDIAKREAPALFARLQYGRIPQRERRVLEEAGVTPPGSGR